MRKLLLAAVAVAVVIALGWWWHGRSKEKAHDGARTASSSPTSSSSSHGGGGLGASAAEQARLATLDGRVLGPGGATVPGATVMATTRDGEPVAEVVRADGSFAFDPLPPGTYTVVAAAPGYLPQHKEVELTAGGKQTVDLTLARGGTELRGTVSDASSGPIAGATVTARARRGLGDLEPVPLAAAITDADGRYAMSLAPGGYRVAAGHPEYVGVASTLDLGTATATLDFRLVPGGAISGIVKDLAGGAPVAGATVIVERDRMGGWTEGRNRVEARTAADGTFRVAGLVPGTLTLRAEVGADGRRSAEPVIVPLGIAEQADGVELWVEAAPYIAGQVVDERDAPVAGAKVFAMGKNDLDGTSTDADGSFRFVGLEPGTWELEASSARHRGAAMVPVTLGDRPVTGVVIKLARAPSVIGRVEPPTAAQVSADEVGDGGMLWGPGLLSGAITTAGDDGRFELAPMEPGRRTINAKASDGRRGKVTVEVPAAGSVEVVITLDEGGSIAGKVADQRGAPVAGAAVLVKSISGSQRRTMIVNGVDKLADRAPTANDGSFLLRGLAAGTYELSVIDERGGKLRWAGAAAGKEREPVRLTLGEREQKQGVALAVELDDGVISGIVRNPDGTARADAWVTASLRPESLIPDLPPPGDDGPDEVSTQIVITDDGAGGLGGTAPVLTGDDGRFELRGLRSGVYDVVAEADKGALRGRTARVATGTDTLVTLAGLAAISGTVTSGGAPVTSFTVELTEPMGTGRRQQTFRDPAGKFRFPRVDVGRYTLRVVSARGNGQAEVTTEAGKTAEVTIAVAATAKVHGRLVDAGGQPVASRPVLALPVVTGEHGSMTFEGHPELTDADGRFALEVDPGDLELLVLGGRGSPRTGKTFTAVGGQDLDLGTITLQAP